jgi:hypothetical protein
MNKLISFLRVYDFLYRVLISINSWRKLLRYNEYFCNLALIYFFNSIYCVLICESKSFTFLLESPSLKLII